jgi:MFS family permease
MNRSDKTPYTGSVTTIPPPDQITVPRPRPVSGGFNLKNTFKALAFRNYRLWFMGHLASLVGTFMQVTAQGFLVYELTESPAYLGYVGFAAGVPAWFLMLYGGVVADRFSRRRLLQITQTYLMVLAIVLAVLTLTGLILPWHIIALSFGVGIGHAFDAPSRHSFVFELVPREHLSNAIALNSTMFNLANTLGPALGGILYVTIGPAGCFILNAFSFLAVLTALQAMKLTSPVAIRAAAPAGKALREGLRYVFRHPGIRSLVSITLVVSFFCMSYRTLMPAWAVNVLHGDAQTNGWLQSARGIGALIGALLIAALGRISYRGRLISMALLAIPVLLIFFALSTHLYLSLILLVGIGLSIIAVFNLVNASIQDLVNDELRGRVMSIYSLVFFGSVPIGSLLAGGIAEYAGEPAAIIIHSLAAFGFGLYIWFFKSGIRAPAE